MAPTDEIEGLLRFSIEIRPDHIYVWHGGELMERDDAKRLQHEIEEAMNVAGCRRVLFDNRATKAPGEAIREFMWKWLARDDLFDRIALVLASLERREAADRRAKNESVDIRTFEDLEPARQWLTGA